MLKYKLTSQDNETYNNTVWGENVTHKTSGEDELCGPGWLHYYHSPEMAVLMNPVHANIQNPKLWECEAEGIHKDHYGLKGGCTKLTTVREIELPEFSTEQRVKFAILCAKKVYFDSEWNKWADNWLSGKDRTYAAADAAADAASGIADATIRTAAGVAAGASYAAIRATAGVAAGASYIAAATAHTAVRAISNSATNAADVEFNSIIDFDEIIKQL